MRKFEKVSAYQHLDFELPKRATSHSAGYDLASIEEVIVAPGEIKMIPTGLKAQMNDNEVLLIYPRSSLGIKRKLTMANNVGVVDQDYYNSKGNEGHIMVPIYNFGFETQTILKGERIAQGIFQSYLKVSDDDNNQNRRESGFGSTDK